MQSNFIQAMKKHHFITSFSAAVILVSCGSRQNSVASKNLKPVKREIPTKTVTKSEDIRDLESRASGRTSKEIDAILKDAEKYLGAPYKFGGVTSSGFDCSGFTSKVFEENDFKLPRRSSDQAMTGNPIDISEVKPGDLLFFATAGGTKVSHVGIVHDIGDDGEVKFIHASTSKGVIISSLNEKYWNKAYLHAQRIF